MMRMLFPALALIFALCQPIRLTAAPALQIKVSNSAVFSRTVETVEIPWEKVLSALPGIQPEAVGLFGSAAGERRPLQVISRNGKPVSVIFQVEMVPASTQEFRLAEAPPVSFAPLVFGRFVPERKDDFAWENNRVAFRMYGPALQATGEISSGVDYWAKRTENLVIDKWYKIDDYHNDHGEGLDMYKVGPTLGAGGAAPFVEGKLCLSKNFVRYEILDKGPLRFTFRLWYDSWTVNGRQITEEKTISLDAGSHLNKTEIVYRGAGLPMQVATGIVHHGDAQLWLDYSRHLIGYWEPADAANSANGSIGVALFFPQAREARILSAEGHWLVVSDYTTDTPFVYWHGAAWSKSPWITDGSEWASYLTLFAKMQEQPLTVSVSALK